MKAGKFLLALVLFLLTGRSLFSFDYNFSAINDLIKSKDYKNAINLLLRTPQKDKFIYNKTGFCYYKLNMTVEAEKYYRKAIKSDANFATAYNNLGVLYYKNAKYDSALFYFKKALSKKTDYARVYINMANIFLERGKFVEAYRLYRKAREIDSQYVKERLTRKKALEKMEYLKEKYPDKKVIIQRAAYKIDGKI